MAYHIKSDRTDRLLRELARIKRKSMAEVIHDALADELSREEAKLPLWERLAPLHRKIDAFRPADRVDWEALKRQNDEDWGI